MNVGSLFSGIGGIDLGLERAGMRIAWQCDNDPWCQRILAKHWPTVPRYTDIRDIDHTAPSVDVIAGGFPCQPVSLAGRGRAQQDDRWLWPEFARLIRLLRPRYVLVENVPGLLARGMGDVLGDLAASGYDAEWDSIGAVDVGAPHRRKRVWIVAYPNTDSGRRGAGAEQHVAAGQSAAIGREQVADAARLRGGQSRLGTVDGGQGRGGPERQRPVSPEAVADAERERRGGWPQRDGGSRPSGRGRPGVAPEPDQAERCQGGDHPPDGRRDGAPRSLADAQGQPERPRLRPGGQRIFGRRRPGDFDSARDAWAAEPAVGRVAHGVPNRVDRLRGLGNAVVPQVVEHIGRRMIEDAQRQDETAA